jgi:hypothetical protein
MDKEMQNRCGTFRATLELILHLFEHLASCGHDMEPDEEVKVRNAATDCMGRAVILAAALAEIGGIPTDEVVDSMVEDEKNNTEDDAAVHRAEIYRRLLSDYRSIPGEVKDKGELSDYFLHYVIALITMINGWVKHDRANRLKECMFLSCTAQTVAVLGVGEGRALQSVDKALEYFNDKLNDKVCDDTRAWIAQLFDAEKLAPEYKEIATFFGGPNYPKPSNN